MQQPLLSRLRCLPHPLPSHVGPQCDDSPFDWIFSLTLKWSFRFSSTIAPCCGITSCCNLVGSIDWGEKSFQHSKSITQTNVELGASNAGKKHQDWISASAAAVMLFEGLMEVERFMALVALLPSAALPASREVRLTGFGLPFMPIRVFTACTCASQQSNHLMLC